jgi:hypothetical protein
MPQPDKGLWPHLPSAFGPQRPQATKQTSLATALYPTLGAKLKPEPSARQRLTPEQAMDWSNVDERFARSVGLVRKDGRR